MGSAFVVARPCGLAVRLAASFASSYLDRAAAANSLNVIGGFSDAFSDHSRRGKRIRGRAAIHQASPFRRKRLPCFELRRRGPGDWRSALGHLVAKCVYEGVGVGKAVNAFC